MAKLNTMEFFWQNRRLESPGEVSQTDSLRTFFISGDVQEKIRSDFTGDIPIDNTAT